MRQYTIKREAYLTPADDKLLDELRGERTRSEAIRLLIRMTVCDQGIIRQAALERTYITDTDAWWDLAE